jgi:hypothetical protein
MTTNQDTPLRYFGKCAVKGCKHRRVIQESSHPKLEAVSSLNGRNGKFLVVRGTADNSVYGLYFVGWKANDQALLDAGLGCPEHGKTVVYTGGKFSHNPRKVCNARCMNATGPSCDCSCSGENHGAKWV